jgi:hypothetical protein
MMGTGIDSGPQTFLFESTFVSTFVRGVFKMMLRDFKIRHLAPSTYLATHADIAENECVRDNNNKLDDKSCRQACKALIV